MKDCPSVDALTAYLRDELDRAACEEIEIHSETCPHCQAQLANLATPRLPVSSDIGVSDFQTVVPILASDAKTHVFAATLPIRKSPPSTEADLPMIPGFEIVRVLGRGGMGVVYEAVQRDLKRRVAVKMLHADATDSLARFQREAEAVAKLKHPNIVGIHAVGTVQERPFLALELVEGGNLAERLREAPMTPQDAATLLEAVARGVHAAHQAGVIHRDLKPANILLQLKENAQTDDPPTWRSFTPKITDFGLARVGAAQDLTQTGELMGTPTYMAPEQTKVKGAHVGPATDVHALGTILYEMVTGRPPFLGAGPVETMLTLINTEAVPPRRLNPSVPRDLETICLKCLEKDPGRRYESAHALAEDLRHYLDGAPIAARPAGAWERTEKWVRRRPAVAALIALLVIVPTIGLPLVTWLWQDAVRAGTETKKALGEKENQRQLAVEAGEKTKQALADEEKQRQVAEANASSLRVVLAQREWLSDHVGQAEKLLDQCPPSYRPWEWRYVKRLCHKELLILRGHTGHVNAVAYSPDGTRLASGGGHVKNNVNLGQVKVWDVDTGRELLQLNGHKGAVNAVAYSPDGQHLASADVHGVIYLWDPVSGAPRHTFTAHDRFVYALAFHPDNTRLVSAGIDNWVRVWDVASAREMLKFREHKTTLYRVNAVAYSPTGDRIASGGGSKFVRVWDAETGKELYRLGPHLSEIHGLAFRADGNQLVSAGGDKTVRIWDLKAKTLLQVLHGHTRSVDAVAFAPDGKSIASTGRDGGLGEIKIWNPLTGEEKWALRGHREGVHALAFRPDGLRLASASADKTVRIWDPTNDLEAHTLRKVAEGYSFSPDSKHVAAVFVAPPNAHRIKILDLNTLQEVAVLAPDLPGLDNVVYSRDGTQLAATHNGYVQLWDLQSKQSKEYATVPRKRIADLRFTPEGALLATTSQNDVRIWNVLTGKPHLTLAGRPTRAESVRYQRDGKLLLTVADSEAKLWNAHDGSLVRTFAGHEADVAEAVLSPDGKTIATASHDRTARIWDTDTGKLLITLAGHGHFVLSVAYSPDGTRLATADNEGAVKLWHAHTGQPLLTLHKKFSEGLPGVLPRPRRLAFSPDGHRLAAWYTDQTIRIWDATPLNEVRTGTIEK